MKASTSINHEEIQKTTKKRQHNIRTDSPNYFAKDKICNRSNLSQKLTLVQPLVYYAFQLLDKENSDKIKSQSQISNEQKQHNQLKQMMKLQCVPANTGRRRACSVCKPNTIAMSLTEFWFSTFEHKITPSNWMKKVRSK